MTTDNEQTTPEPPDRIWLTPQFAEAANVIGGGVYHVNLPPEDREGCIEYTRVSAASTAPVVDETDKVLLEALRRVRADQDSFWTFYQADPLMVKAADRIEELLRWHSTEQSMHAAWRKRAEEAEAQLTPAAASPAALAIAELLKEVEPGNANYDAVDLVERVRRVCNRLRNAEYAPAAPQEDAGSRTQCAACKHGFCKECYEIDECCKCGAEIPPRTVAERLAQHEHIEIVDGVLGGVNPLVSRRRISVHHVLSYLYNGESVESIAQNYQLTPEAIKDAIAFAQEVYDDAVASALRAPAPAAAETVGDRDTDTRDYWRGRYEHARSTLAQKVLETVEAQRRSMDQFPAKQRREWGGSHYDALQEGIERHNQIVTDVDTALRELFQREGMEVR